MLIVIIILLIVTFAFIFKIIKLRLVLKLQFNSDEKSIEIRILFFSYQIFLYKLKLVKKDAHFEINYYKKGNLITAYTLKEIEDKIKDIFHQYKKSFDLVEHEVIEKIKRVFINKIVAVEGLNVKADLGLNDAMATALTHGVLLAITNALISRFYDPNRKPKEFCVNLNPIFHRAAFEINMEVIISIRLSSAAAIGGALIFLFLRNKKLKE